MTTIHPDTFLAMPVTAQRLILAGLGFHIFELAQGKKKPLPGSRGFKDATTDPDTILGWGQDTNTGIATGASGLVVLDCDNHEGTTPETPWDLPGITTGEDALAMLWHTETEAGRAEAGTSPWAECPATLTPSGGVHLIYRARTPGRVRNSAGKLAWQVDVRANGGYIVAPGSILDGSDEGDTPGIYRPLHWPQDTPTAPEWLEETLAPPARPFTPARAAASGSIFAPAPGPDPDAPEADRIRLAVARKVAEAQPGERNQLLNWGAYRLAEQQLLDQVGAGMLADAARAIGLTDQEITNTLRSATRATQGATR